MKLSVLLILISFNTAALAQVKEKNFPSNWLRCQHFELEARTGTDSLPLPFSGIRLMDVRSDTSKYGFFRPPGVSEQFKYCFKNGTNAQLTGFMNSYLVNNLDTNNTAYVLMCLRRLWITRDDTIHIKQGIKKNRAQTLFKADFYLYSNNTFQPLFRIDTTISRESLKRVYALGMVEEALQAALERLKTVDYARANARNITEAEIRDYYKRMNNVPVLTSRPAKGVYRTFAEFRQNQPSDTSFEIKFEALADHLYVKDKNGNEYLERNVWGICDGQTLFIKLQSNFYQLFRHQNTWEFYGIKRQEMALGGGRPAYGNPAYSAPSPQAGLLAMGLVDLLDNARINFRTITVYQVDMETGKIF